MLDVCSHEFFWPRRAADGHYYELCRLCGVEYEYDWKNMRRMDDMGGVPGPETTRASHLSISQLSNPKISADAKDAPRLSLLLELEPAYRVFFRNLTDVLRSTSPIATTSPPAPFWHDVFVYSGAPWRRLGESLLGHVIAVAAVLILSHYWVQRDQPSQRRIFDNSYVSYYTPSQSFPALRSSPPQARPQFKRRPESTSQGMIKVAPEHAQTIIKPSDLKLTGPARPNMVVSNLVPPVMPLAATGRSQLTVPASPTAVVAPPPDIIQATSRRPGLPQASVVAPALEVGAVSSRPAISAPNAAVIGPPPMVHASIRKAGKINIGPYAVVAPLPRLPMGEQRAISGVVQPTLGSPIALAVPPPPSIQRSGTLADGRAGSLSSGGLQVVPPPPSVQAVQDVGNSTEGGHLSSLSSIGLQAVPPAPSVQGASNSGAQRRASTLSGTGLQAVPPAPSAGDAGNSGTDGRQVAMNIHPPLAPSPPPIIHNARPLATEEAREPATEELQVRVIGLALALPNSSYFSNYEVFIAEKQLRKNQAQLIKLVYVWLPYQRRLSEYRVDNSKVYKLRVSRDLTCDESLLQMTWPETDPRPDSQNSTDSPALSANDRNSMLPCYRTTADDYRRAVSRDR
jgi:hypothetical protein